MSSAEQPGSSPPGGPVRYDPEAELDRQRRRAGRIVQSLVLLISGAIIYSIAAPAGLAVMGFTAALLSTLASISIALLNLNLPVLSRPIGIGFHTASWGKVSSAALTVVALAADVVTVALIISVH